MAYCGNQTSLFGTTENYIKFYNGDLVAVEGANIIQTQILKNLRIPYSQVLRGRITLKPGQVDYLLNHLGLGDNATLVSIAVTYDPKSKVEADNFVNYTFYNDMTVLRSFCEIIILTGNSTNRVPQLYLTNPNPNYAVMLDVMVASKSDEYNYFVDTVNQAGTSFVGLSYSSIKTHIVDQSIKVVDSQNRALIYLTLTGISTVSPNGLILEIDDLSRGTIFLKFIDTYSVNQAFSLINYVLENEGIDIDSLSPVTDDIAPQINFRDTVLGTSSIIDLVGGSGGPYNSSQGLTFSTEMSLSTFGTISTNLLVNTLISSVVDNRDGTMSVTGSNLSITKDSVTYTSITASGTYSVLFSGIKDLAQNTNSNIILNLTVTP